MKIIKRNGSEAVFNPEKIYFAVEKANSAVNEEDRIEKKDIETITQRVTERCESLSRPSSVEEVQDMVEREIMALGAFTLAKTYITYRYNRALVRKANTTDDRIMSLIDCTTRRLSRKTQTKTPPSTAFSVTIWQARFPRILLTVFFFPPTS